MTGLSNNQLAISELEDMLSSYQATYGTTYLIGLRNEIAFCNKSDKFTDIADEIEMNEGEAFIYYAPLCSGNLFECDELDEDIVNFIDSHC